MKKFTIYEYETIVTKYVVKADVPIGIDSKQFVKKMESTDGWDMGEFFKDRKTVSAEVTKREVWDTETDQLLFKGRRR